MRKLLASFFQWYTSYSYDPVNIVKVLSFEEEGEEANNFPESFVLNLEGAEVSISTSIQNEVSESDEISSFGSSEEELEENNRSGELFWRTSDAPKSLPAMLQSVGEKRKRTPTARYVELNKRGLRRNRKSMISSGYLLIIVLIMLVKLIV